MNPISEKPAYLERIKRLKDRVMETRPSMDLENAKILTESFQQTESQPNVLRKAKAFREQCRRKTVTIWDDELIVGCSGSRIRGGILCADVCWSILDRELDTISNRPFDPFYLDEESRNIFLETVKPFWKGKSNYEQWLAQMPEDVAELRENTVIYIDRKAVRGPGELTAGFDLLLAEGINGIIARIEKKKAAIDPAQPGSYPKRTYLEALKIVAEGIITLAERYGEEAERMAAEEQNPVRREELAEIAGICRYVPANPARTFYEAMQSVYLYHICTFMEQNAASYNPGRMDQYLWSFYKADLEAGRITPDKAQELFDCLWIKYSEPCLFQDEVTAEFASGYNMFQNVCAGGIDENGQDAVNDLSYMILQATMDVKLYQPSLSVRYNLAKNPNTFLRKIVELIKLGTGFPAFHNDEVGIRMMQNKGVPLREAYDWNPCGCVETNLMGKMKGYTAIADVNLGSIVEFVLLNGVQRKSGQRLGVDSGDPTVFNSYADFAAAAKKQLAYVIRKVVEANSVLDEIWDDRPVPVTSLTHPDCIEKALDYAWGGPKYNTGNGIIFDGVADFINSVAAVKHLVFEEKKIGMADLLAALDADFEGHEATRKLCLEAPKFGNDNPVVDDVASDMFAFIATETEKYHGKYGRMMAGMLPVTAHVPLGLVVGALPSGRHAWTTLTDGISPTGSTDINGATSVLKSISKIPHDLFVSGTLLNMKVEPALLETEVGMRNLMALLKSLCSLGIYHVQFNVISAETLQQAQLYPDDYRDLLIRVAGYTAYFVELGKDVQDEIINRTVQQNFTGHVVTNLTIG
jgi:formate C-acetyltransferase